MKTSIKNLYIPAVILLFSISSCTKMRDAGILNTSDFTDTTDALKTDADFTMGVAIDYNPMINDAKYSGVVSRDFDRVTFGYQMKHGAIVKDDGTMDFSKADALVNAVGSTQIHGHTLSWYANQNATYLKMYAGLNVASATELLTNPGFESGLTAWSTFNSSNGATVTATNVATEVHLGSGAMKVVNPVANPGNQWKVQVASNLFNTISGHQYTISYWVKAAAAGGSIRLSSQDQNYANAQYQADQTIGTTYTQITWTITANSSQTRILFDMGLLANTYYIDDASVKEIVVAPTTTQVAAKLDTALNTFITATVNRYKNKVHSWDVVNELFADDGNLRNNTNTSTSGSDILVWSNYMGRDYPLKAFNYAKAADPTALFFINDYNLESKPVKLDSLIAMVNELKSKGAKIDGIGTQMHIAYNTSYDGIDQMMQKLAATGLLIHLSELDVKINPSARAGFVLTPLEANYQAEMYHYAIQSYLKYIPKAQQFGITIWGITDNTSWLYNNGQDFPLLYNADYSKKQAYAAVINALKGK